MAVIKAQATGNWSATGTWSGGVVPSLNDTVYANGFTVALDQAVDLTGSTVDTSGSFIPGQIYMVVSVGTTNFALTANCIAPGTNAGTAVAITSAVGQIFQAVNAGTATTGTARRMGALLNYVNTPLTIATGGSFTLAASYNITGAYIQAGSANCLTVSAAASSTLAGCYAIGSAFTLSTRAIAFSSSGILTLNGIVAVGGRLSGTSTANGTHAIESTSAAGTIDFTNASTLTGGSALASGLNNASTGSVTVTSSTITGGSGTNANGLNNASTGTVTVTSSTITGGTGGGSFNSGINNASTGTVTVTSSTLTGGSTNANGLNNASTGSVTVTSSTITGGSGTNTIGLNNASTGTIVSTGDIAATNSAIGLLSDSTSASVKISGSLIGSANGIPAIYSAKYLIDPTPTTAKFRHGKNGSTTYSDFFTADNSLGQAAPSNVRAGTVYANGNLTGSCAVPAAGSVALGVPVDNATGTAALTPAAVWEYATRALTTSTGATAAEIRAEMDANSTKLANLDTTVSSRLAPSGTLATVTTLTNSPNVPSAAAIADEVRVELATELGRIDAAVSSRLAPSGTLAVVTTLTNAPASVTPAQIRAEMDANSTKLANLDAAVSSRLATSGYTAPSAAPTAVSIRDEIDSNSTKLAGIKAKTDNLPASPAASGDIPSANITAIKAKTDALVTDRLAQCSTVATTGAQLAAALS